MSVVEVSHHYSGGCDLMFISFFTSGTKCTDYTCTMKKALESLE